MNFPAARKLSDEGGFSLLELLVVVLIVCLLAVLTTPAVVSLLGGTRLTTGGQAALDALNRSRQLAVSRGVTVEVRLYRYAPRGAGEGSRYRAMQSFLIASGSAIPLDRGMVLPDGVHFTDETTLSPLLSSTNHPEMPVPAGMWTPGGGAQGYRAFRFSSRGAADLSLQDNYLTLVPDSFTKGVPKMNFVSLQILPLSGNVREFRP